MQLEGNGSKRRASTLVGAFFSNCCDTLTEQPRKRLDRQRVFALTETVQQYIQFRDFNFIVCLFKPGSCMSSSQYVPRSTGLAKPTRIGSPTILAPCFTSSSLSATYFESPNLSPLFALTACFLIWQCLQWQVQPRMYNLLALEKSPGNCELLELAIAQELQPETEARNRDYNDKHEISPACRQLTRLVSA
jgi:hypothetical protein